jgi:hypothetical protein
MTREPNKALKVFVWATLVLMLAAACGPARSVEREDDCPKTSMQHWSERPAGLASLEALLAKIKADHPDWAILKVDLASRNENGESSWIYVAKLFPPDGRIQRQIFDAITLKLLEESPQGGGRNCPWRRRFRGGAGE